jgi:hypothetical protein
MAVLAAIAVIGAAARAQAQSLADLAKKEEDRRKNVQAPAKVYTNKDLGPVPASPPPATTTPTKETDAKDDKTAAKDDKAGGDAGKEQPKDKAYWAGRLQALQTQLDRDSTFADALQSKINALTADFSARDDPAQRAAIERDRQKSLTELNRLKQAMVEDKKAIADLQEEARRAGVPPGWLR